MSSSALSSNSLNSCKIEKDELQIKFDWLELDFNWLKKKYNFGKMQKRMDEKRSWSRVEDDVISRNYVPILNFLIEKLLFSILDN